MQFTHAISYQAPAAVVFEMLSDPEFRRRSAQAMGVLSVDVRITAKGEGMSVIIDQVQPTEGVPSFAKKVVGSTTRAIQTEEWSSPTDATIDIDIPGKPISVTGTLRLREAGGVTTETMDAEARVKVPLIGGTLGSLMAALVGKGMDKEHGVGIAWLQERA